MPLWIRPTSTVLKNALRRPRPHRLPRLDPPGGGADAFAGWWERSRVCVESCTDLPVLKCGAQGRQEGGHYASYVRWQAR